LIGTLSFCNPFLWISVTVTWFPEMIDFVFISVYTACDKRRKPVKEDIWTGKTASFFP
jgi:hypothetical protein